MRALANGLLALTAAAVLSADARATLAADAGATYLTWWACPGDLHAAPGVAFDCAAEGGAVYTLIGTFDLAEDVPRALSMTADINIAFPGAPSVPTFWDIDPAGCNPNAFALVKGTPVDCGDHLNAFCPGDTNRCDLVYSVLLVPGSNVLQLSIAAGRGLPNATPLVAGQRYFAFALNIPMFGTASCSGCTLPCAIGFTRGTIYSLDAQGLPLPPIAITGTFPGARACATVNDGSSACTAVPVQRLTWGRLKSLYR